MEAAANCSLRVKRLLLDPKFEGYKLSLEPLACYQLGLDSAVAEVKLRDDQYTLDHMRAFGMYNYLHLDSWYQDNVYYVDQLGRVMNLSVTLDTAFRKPREVFRLPSDVTACDNRLCASIHFSSSTWVTISDGTGSLFLIKTGKRGDAASEKWEIMFNEELGSPFVIAHSVSFVKSDVHSVAGLLLRVEKDELDAKGSGFHVSLEWVTITEVDQEDNQRYEIFKRRVLQGKSVPHYAAIEPDGDGLMIVSYKPFKFMQDEENQLEKKEDGKIADKKKDPVYYWQQTEDDLTVTIHLPQDITKDDIQVQFSPDHIIVALKSQPPLVEGKLCSSIDHESCTWIIRDNSLEISLIKKDEGPMWPELIVGDARGEFIMDSSQCSAVAERLIHLTSEEMNPNPDKENPPCNAQELEECDIFLEDSTSLCRFDGNTLKITHVVNLGSNQYLFSAVVDPKEMPCFCLRHDIDALLWQPRYDQPDNMWEHIATFNALGYVQASKEDKKFTACPPNYSYAAICECLRRVFIYRQPTPLSTVLYNRKEGRQVGQVAKQLVATLEASDPILGFQATNERLFVLTTKSLFLIKVNTEN
ncbi:nudC domain-containing protein 1 [Malaclemys terrapin pileata]|uniref:nudC domain-containing protein 1 n=1 Tax=Malaclemys terrapin pileata TaxID=2991368 RepID=UPI0023A8556B|nr:nudC domain-containing protein 1 [Malaclemys terrapin pileata]